MKKRVFELVTLIILVLGFIFLVAFENIDPSINYYETLHIEGPKQESYVIKTREELEQYVFDEEMLEKYDEKYFEEKQLVYIVHVLECCNIKARVTDYVINDGVMDVNILRKMPKLGSMGIINLNILIEVENVEINEINITVEEQSELFEINE